MSTTEQPIVTHDNGLKTRQPTGVMPWPLVLVEGGEKTGKSWNLVQFSTSERIAKMLWLDLGEGAADEYGAVPGADYEILVHDGTYASIMAQLDAAIEYAEKVYAETGLPCALGVDSMTLEWDSLRDWANERAKRQRSNAEKLRKDPNADIAITMNLWNDVHGRHGRFMAKLFKFPGPVIATARGGEVAKVENGKPVEGEKTYKVEGHKNLGYDCNLWIRLSRTAPPTVIGARSARHGIRPGIDDPQPLLDGLNLDHLLFDVLGLDSKLAHKRDYVPLSGGELTPEEMPPPDEEQPDRAQNRRTASAREGTSRVANAGKGARFGTQGAAPAANQQAVQAVTYVARSGDADTAAKRMQWVIERPEIAEIPVRDHLPADVADILGIVDGQHDDKPVTVLTLAELVVGYCERHIHGPLNPPVEDKVA